MKISKLQKKMGQFTLQIEELYLESGKVHGLIGTNGCGKTTLSKLIQGILVPDGGRIDYEGLTPRDITMTTQRPYLLHDTVYQNLIYPLKIRGIRPDEAKDGCLAGTMWAFAEKKSVCSFPEQRRTAEIIIYQGAGI